MYFGFRKTVFIWIKSGEMTMKRSGWWDLSFLLSMEYVIRSRTALALMTQPLRPSYAFRYIFFT